MLQLLKQQFSKQALSAAFAVVAIGSALCAAAGFAMLPFFAAAALAGIAIVYICFTQPRIGFYIITVISFFTALPDRLLRLPLPISTGIEVLVFIVFLGSFAVRKKEAPSNLIRTPASIAFCLFALFLLIELFNPSMHSAAGWAFYIRRFGMFMLIYVVSYRLFPDVASIKTFLKLWFALAVLAAAYACFQQWFGLMPFEKDYLARHPHEYKLYFQGGTIKKFSFLSDPTTFGIMAGACSLFMLVLAINTKIVTKRRLYFAAFLVLTTGMSYSGTRTTNIMLPAGLALYALLTITNRTTLVTIFVAALTALFILFGPIENGTINRIRSTFNGKEESLAVRDENRRYIQPYIYSHPIGGGIATSGVHGEKYNPHHVLAGFPPDSGLLLAAIEMGWIGYALTILVYFLILYQCIHYYFLTRNVENKTFIIALTVALFTIIVTQYSQVTIGQLPTALFFYAVLSITARLKETGLVAAGKSNTSSEPEN